MAKIRYYFKAEVYYFDQNKLLNKFLIMRQKNKILTIFSRFSTNLKKNLTFTSSFHNNWILKSVQN